MTSVAIRLKELDDDELEEFVELWCERLGAGYHLVERIGKANDKGRDVIGFMTPVKHEGPWHLYQCKRKTLRSALGVPEALSELGKVFHHHREGAYRTLPERYFFVAPRGVAGPLQDLIFNPSDLKAVLIAQWDQHCAGSITRRRRIPLSPALRTLIDAYDFGSISHLSATGLAKHPAARTALTMVLKEPPGDAPAGSVPAVLLAEEMEYVDQLRRVYGEARGAPFATADAVLADGEHGDHLREQRTRFFDARSFRLFHRDNTSVEALRDFEAEIYHGVIEVYRQVHQSRLDRVAAVMRHAATMPSAILGKLARVPVRQGMCHHLANEGQMKWVP
ncbi:ABC-three component system protein [Methylobacterium thuringiense]|uniref:Restriction endonuclease type IV Mrr domain-containing protein n=1 Tax=Methylobacterium thuringiense TaxID=1003091 RepID=A0ABQ4TLE3_9HYPH|nr:ABC-three component system protein [Methylobacterium thuringiense]GJE54892.1 hypothetical protein EKPJFOCH_1377 [Methylobacterium thuringiense]